MSNDVNPLGEKLLAVSRGKDFALYRIEGKYCPELRKYVISTPWTRDVLNNPEIVGHKFTESLKRAVIMSMANFPEPEVMEGVTDLTCNVFHFLRGGLNFGIPDALYHALGFNMVSSSFMTSQRDKDPEGRWFIKDDQYQKFTFTKDATIFCGDIVATGSTIDNGLKRLFKLAKNSGKPIKNLIFFTVGCHKIEKILAKYHDMFKTHFKGYGNTFIFYVEGKFHLADSHTDLHIKLQGTDLLRQPALIAPEFELSQYDSVSAPLERCVIYDGGTRKFDAAEYFDDVIHYWVAVRQLAKHGWTLGRAYLERWPETEYQLPYREFCAYKEKYWEGVPDSFMQKLYQARQNRWSGRFAKQAESSDALLHLAEERLAVLSPDGIPFPAARPVVKLDPGDE
ncbi:MAG: hypothetical protein CVV64_17390 [Candidatus Wallbacteria bacterium HGW-Wallbacteria-1]|jgi:hypothetical protein|uniref:Uncharacterized protein n=1 Tax=Candidatus Wallbacteria bacterium HGW-Wallbacteria-1 TaxID=2013854 RepID=A0A2N1PKA9_9BACT|nr:MAG: hypothetical protein CVV64_17390 [Candidatus Wallbacteria bacterium HGW-Wallbacteria-1]